MNRALLIVLLLALACSRKDKYDVDGFHNVMVQDSVLASMITYIYTAPPYTAMADRFKPEHRQFYVALTPKFTFQQYFVADDGTHYFYIIRPASRIGESRGVGGHFKMDDGFRLTNFREVFVTPVLSDAELKTRGAFLFDQMVKGNIADYLSMPSYVQWPNPVSAYDTTTFEWKLTSP